MQNHIVNRLIFLTQLSIVSLPITAAELIEDDLYGDLPIITSASRLNQSTLSSPSAVTVIDRAMIDASGFIEIADIFRLVPGFQVAHADGSTFAVINHGDGWEYPSRMQLLIDGRSTYTSALSAIDWNTLGITLEDIDRIEVVRGPAASAYGSNSFSGAINIITIAPEIDDKLQLSYRFGNNGERRLLLRHSNTIDNLSYRVTGSTRHNSGFDDNPDTRDLRDVSLTSRYTLNAHNSFFGQFSSTNGDAGMRNIDRRNNSFYDRDRSIQAWSAHLRWDHILSDTEEIKVNFYHNFLNEDDMTMTSWPLHQLLGKSVDRYYKQGYDILGDPYQKIRAGERSYRSNRSDMEVQYSAIQDSGIQYVLGAGGRYDTMRSEAFFPDKGLASNSSFRAFGNLQLPLSTLFTVNLGGLYEVSNIIHSNLFSPRVSLTWHLNDKQSIRTTYSKAYRIPSLLEKNMDAKLVSETNIPIDYLYMADNSIKAEKVHALDLGYVGRSSRLPLSWEIRTYREEYNNTIIFYGDEGFPDPADGEIRRIGNMASTTMYGFEGEVTFRPEQSSFIRLHFNRGHMSGQKVKDINQPFPKPPTEWENLNNNAPRKSYGILAAKTIDTWQFNIGLYHVGKMRWEGLGDEVDSYTRVDASIIKRIAIKDSQEIVLRIGGQNIGNNSYYEFINDNQYGLLYEPRYYASITYLNF